jgi:hypothetical protein
MNAFTRAKTRNAPRDYQPLLLGAATAITVIVQNRRLTVLWDLSYILENAWRIAAGQIPYRDFPFPYAPLTFVTQALVIRIFGRAAWHHIAYAAIAAGVATALTYVIVRRITGSRAAAFLLTLPLLILGIYCVFPHPFYDPDCCLVVLGLLVAVTGDACPSTVFGALCVVPLFVKQNIGLAFLAAIILYLVIRRCWRALGGVAIGGGVALALVAAIFGAGNYVQWTIRFAAQRRLPPLAQQLSIYTDDATLWWWLACVIVGALVARRARVPGLAIIAVPWLWTLWQYFASDDPLEPQINLLRMWPLLIVAALLTRQWIAFLVVATIHGAFLSQSTWGSTYGIWPLLVILLALGFASLRIDRASLALAALIVAVTLLGGWHYVAHNERLTYAKVAEGEMHHGLGGLSMRGEWLPQFEALVAWTDRNIPRDDAILCLPGEDLFYFATGRRPRVPVLMFDRTINPFDARQIAAFDVRWVIVKQRLQLNGTPMESEAETLRLLAPRLRLVAQLPNHNIYRRVQ